jgi:hypothetical protein
MMPLPLLAAGALKAAPYVISGLGILGSRRRRGEDTDFDSLLNADYPTGKVTDDDIWAAERTKTRLRRAVTDRSGQGRDLIRRRAAQRGTLGSSALETTLARLGEGEALGLERAGAVGEEQLDNMRIGRERFAQNRAMAVIGGRLRDASDRRYQGTLRQTAFTNSMLELSRAMLASMPGGGGAGGASSGGFMDSTLDDSYLYG